MAIERDVLIKIMEAFLDSSEIYYQEMWLYKGLFEICCQANGLTDEKIQEVVERGRTAHKAAVGTAALESHKALLATLPQIIDLLESDAEKTLDALKEWLKNPASRLVN